MRHELGHDADRRERFVFRVLAVRQLAQAIGSTVPPVRRVGVAVDILHGASMVAVVVFGPPWFRRAAAIQSALAGGFVLWAMSSAPA